MKLADLLKGVAVRELKAPPELEIEDICYDSRRAAPGTLFVAVRGLESDGHRYIASAACYMSWWRTAAWPWRSCP